MLRARPGLEADAAEPTPTDLVVVGEIVGAQGVRGEVRLRSFAATPSDIERYSPLLAADGRPIVVTGLRPLGGSQEMFAARVSGVSDRDAAEALIGTKLQASRSQMLAGLGEDEFLHADLIGCNVELADGRVIGAVVSIHNFGAGDLVEIALEGRQRTEFLPFARAFVPVVDLPQRRIVVTQDPSAA